MVYHITGVAYMQQLASARKDQQKFFADLEKAGWKFWPELQIWTHPNLPGREIML